MQAVLYITNKKIFLKSSSGKTATINWNGQDIKPVFETLKKTIKTSELNIVLSNDLSYTLALEATTNPTRQQILEKAKEHMPENIDNHNFDWQKKGDLIQVIATPAKFLNNLSQAAKTNKIKLGSIQTSAAVLSQSTTSNKHSHLILHKNRESLIVASFKGVALLVHNQPNIDLNILVNIASIVKQKYNLEVKEIIISGVHVDKSISVPAQWELVKKNTDIMATASKKKKTTTKDKDELEIKPVVDPVEETKESEETSMPSIDDEPAEKEEPEKKEEPEVDTAKEEKPEEEIKEDDTKLEESTTESPSEEKEPVEEEKVEEAKEPELDTDKEEVSDQETETKEPDPILDATAPIPMTPEIKFDQDSEPKDEQATKTKSNKGLFISLAITLVVGGSLTGGILYSRSATTNQDIRSKAAEVQESPESTPTPNVSATPTPEEINLLDYSLQIQNGSGTAGQAGVVDELLQAEGFEEAETANADSYNYLKTEVQVKKDSPEEIFNAIDRALNSDYQVIVGDVLDEDSSYDAIVIVGAKK